MSDDLAQMPQTTVIIIIIIIIIILLIIKLMFFISRKKEKDNKDATCKITDARTKSTMEQSVERSTWDTYPVSRVKPCPHF